MADVQLEPGWKMALFEEFEKPYMNELKAFLKKELDAKKQVFPKPALYFNAFNTTPIEDVKVVILGQDPYHGPGQAHGLSFSVPEGVQIPPSLQNIYKELVADLGVEAPKSGNLTHWAEQGVLLLNATLSVEAHKAGSHQKMGWETFTDKAIEALSEMGDGIVFVLWGAYAQKKGEIIDESRHLVLKAPHPSPLSAHRGFFGSKPFSQINSYLEERGEEPIRWV